MGGFRDPPFCYIKTMRALSSSTKHSFARLYRKVPTPQLLLGGSAEQCRLIVEVGNSGEAAAVPYLAPFLLRPRTRTTAMSAIAALMSEVDARVLPRLEEMRGLSFPWRDEGGLFSEWLAAKPSVLGDIDDGSSDSLYALGLLSFHWSGFLREAAVRCLAQRPEAEAIAFLLLRANDWVPQVRSRAKKALTKAVSSEGPEAFARFLPLVTRLSGTRRDNHAPLLETIEAMFQGRDGARALRGAALSPDRYVRRSAYQRAWQFDDQDAEPFLELATNDFDAVVRTGATRRTVDLVDADQAQKWLRRLMRDRLVGVRRIALYGWVDRFPNSMGDDAFMALLMDRSPSLREGARFYVRRKLAVDLVKYYRERFQSEDPGQRAIAISAFGEVADEGQPTEVEVHLNDPAPHVRTVALRALGMLLPTSKTKPFVDGLRDPVPSISKAACVCLMHRSPPHTALDEVLRGDFADHCKINALKLLSRRSRWRSLESLIRATPLVEGKVRDWAQDAMWRWIRRNRAWPYAPPRAECECLDQLLRQFGESLGPIKYELRGILDT